MSNDQQGTPRPDDETQPVRAEGPAAAADADAAVPPARRGFGERLRRLRRSEGGNRSYGLAALIASALAGVIVGGVGVSAVRAITHDGPRDRFEMMQRQDDRGPGFGDRGDGMRGGMHGGMPGMPGQMQPTTPPEDEDGSNS